MCSRNGGSDGEGDNNDQTPYYPLLMKLDIIVSVSAIDQSGNLCDFSNYGSDSVDLGQF